MARLLSPLRQTVSKYVHCGLSQSQIKLSLVQDYPNSPIHYTKLIHLMTNVVKIDRIFFSIYDLKN